MAIAFDAMSSASRVDTSTSLSWTHTPVGTPRGIVVVTVQETSAAAIVTGVTYGGVAMESKAVATDTATELGRSECWFLGSNIPTGSQTVTMSIPGAEGNDIIGGAVSFTADNDTYVVHAPTASEDAANPSVTTQVRSVNSIAVGGEFNGLNALPSVVHLSGMTTVLGFDSGIRVLIIDYQTTPSTSNFVFGYTSVSDDQALAVVAVGESNAHLRFRPEQRRVPFYTKKGRSL